MKRRSNFEIMAAILAVCRTPCSRAHVMYNAYLSWGAAQTYLQELVARGLLSIHNTPIRYATTPKGRTFIAEWKRLADIL
jgi:predicted transcriptional regulator